MQISGGEDKWGHLKSFIYLILLKTKGTSAWTGSGKFLEPVRRVMKNTEYGNKQRIYQVISPECILCLAKVTNCVNGPILQPCVHVLLHATFQLLSLKRYKSFPHLWDLNSAKSFALMMCQFQDKFSRVLCISPYSLAGLPLL